MSFADSTDAAGADFVVAADSPDDVLRFWVEGDAFPRIVIDPNNVAIYTGNGTAYPTTVLGA